MSQYIADLVHVLAIMGAMVALTFFAAWLYHLWINGDD